MPHRRSILLVTLAALGAFSSLGLGEAGTLAPGEYLTEGSWGSLTISRQENQATHFSIEATGANAHICTLEGEVQNGRAILDTGEPEQSCVVTFRPNARGIDVSAVDMEACRGFCGMRASFDGEYLVPRPGCASKDLGAAGARFKQLYDAKSYARAAAVLEPILTRCSKTLHPTGEMRNDLAITQYHLGRLADCRKTLQPLAEDAASTDEELQARLPPYDFEVYLPIVQATRYNLKLCAGKKR